MKLQLWVYLAIALALSVGCNIWQLRADIIEDTEAAGAIKLATEQGKNQALTEQISAIDLLATQKVIDDAELLRLRAEVAESEGKTITVYRDRVKGKSLACQASETQVKAINEALK